MKICIHCGVTYDDSDYLCWKCDEYLVPAKECPSCEEWMDADFDICEACHTDWVRKFLRHAEAFRSEITDAQMGNFEKWSDEDSLLYFYQKLRKVYPNEPKS